MKKRVADYITLSTGKDARVLKPKALARACLSTFYYCDWTKTWTLDQKLTKKNIKTIIRYANREVTKRSRGVPRVQVPGSNINKVRGGKLRTASSVRVAADTEQALLERRRFYSSNEWAQLKSLFLSHFSKNECMNCGREEDVDKPHLHVDHIKPRSVYPELSLDLTNLQILCRRCNISKGNVDESDYRPEWVIDTMKRHKGEI